MHKGKEKFRGKEADANSGKNEAIYNSLGTIQNVTFFVHNS